MNEAILLTHTCPSGVQLLLQIHFFFLLCEGTVTSIGPLTHTKGKITKLFRKALLFSTVEKCQKNEYYYEFIYFKS